MRSSKTTVIVAAAFAFSINAAMAASPANPIPHQARAPHAAATQHLAARRLPPRNQLNVDVAQFVRGMLGGGPVPYANLVRDVRGMRGAGTYASSDYSSPTYDTSVPDSGAAAAQAASDAENQAIQSMNDTNALNASMAAAEQENDAANAATLQTEINAAM
jgi:hypothetical protein